MADLELKPNEAQFLCEVFWQLGYHHEYIKTWESLLGKYVIMDRGKHPNFMDDLAKKLNEYFSGETGRIVILEEFIPNTNIDDEVEQRR